MKKSIESGIVLFLAIISILFSAPAPLAVPMEKDQAGGVGRKLVAVIPEDFPPTYFRNPADGKPAGLAVDVMNALARSIGLDVEYRFAAPWDEIEDDLLSGQADLIPFRVINDKTRDRFILTRSVDATPVNYITRSSAAAPSSPVDGSKIGVIRGSTAHEHLKGRHGIEIVLYESLQHMLMDLLIGHLDLILAPAENVLPLARNAGLDEKLRKIEPPAFEVFRAIALRPGAEALRDRLNRAIESFENTPDARAIYSRWLRSPEPYWTVNRVSMLLGVCFALLLATLLTWRFVEMRRMNRRLDAERAFLQTMIDLIPEPVFFKDHNGVYLGCNTFFAQAFLGRSKGRILGRNDFEFFPDKNLADFFRRRDREAMEAGEPTRNDEWITLADGRAILVETIKTPFRDNTGAIAGIIGISRDVTARDLATHAQADARRRLQTFLDNLPMIAWLKDRDGRFEMVNETFAEMFGRSVEEVLGKTDFDLSPPDLAEKYHSDDQEVIVSGRKKQVEEIVLSRGEPRWHLTFKTPIVDESGQVTGSAGIAQDITERKLAEEALREGEERYRTLFLSMSQGVIYLQADGAPVDVNPAAIAMLGYPRKDLLRRNSSDPSWQTIREDGSRLPVDQYPSATAIRTGKPVKDMVLGHFNPQLEQYIWLIVNAIPQFRQGETTPHRVFVTMHDITKRKRAEEALRTSETNYKMLSQEFKTVLEAIPDSLSLISPDHRIVWANLRAEETMRGRGGGPVHGEHCHRLWHNRTEPCEDCILLKTDVSGEQTLTSVTASDGRKWEFRMIPVKDDSGRIINTLRLGRDVTEREEFEARLRQSQKLEAIGKLAGGIAHDFNNILSPILGFSELALLATEGTSTSRGYLEQVIAAATRARDLVKQILAFSRMTDHQPMEPTDIGPVVIESLKLLRASLPATIEIRGEIEQGIALANPTQIQQVVLNLCANAAHAMEDRGTLEVSLARIDMSPRELSEGTFVNLKPGPYLKLSVSDSGCGMDSETLQRIFEPYFTTREVGKGTGLGLAVVHGIVKRHGGEINVLSEKGKGSRFDIFIPSVTTAPARPVIQRGTPPSGHEHILMVDDERMIVDLCRKILQDLGYRVTTETSAEQALELFRARPADFDLIVTDYTMPTLTGIDLAREISRIRPDTPIILCTGFSERLTPEIMKSAGIREFAMKPLDRQELAKLVRRVLDQKEARVPQPLA